MFTRLILSGITLTLLAALMWPAALRAQERSPAQLAEAIRAGLLDAQMALSDDPAEAQTVAAAAGATYAGELAAKVAAAAPETHRRIQEGLTRAVQAAATGDAAGLSAARAQVWTALLAGGYQVVATSLAAGDATTAQRWLSLREFRVATRFSRPNADATLAVAAAVDGAILPAEALLAVRADFLDTYQARLSAALLELQQVDAAGFAARRAEEAALAEGYFAILAPAYREQFGAGRTAEALAAFAALRTAALGDGALETPRAAVEAVLQGFRAAPLSAAEQARRAGQMQRFLSLVPVEYGRGVQNGAVSVDLEIREAVTFRDGAAAAFADLRPLLEADNPEKAAQAAMLFQSLGEQLASANAQAAPEPKQVRAETEQLAALLAEIMPAAWQAHDSAADFDVISTALDQMEQAAAAGQYELAESARLEAYAIMESGPEARLVVFAPEYKPRLESLFWYGAADRPGLARLIADGAPLDQVQATRKLLNAELAAAQEALAGTDSPSATITNAGVIVFREGLEAVLILASLMASLKSAERSKYRRSMWWGAAAACLATVATWFLAHEVLAALARYGEKLEAVVSLIAIGVLLLITNWFFHQVYWVDHMAGLHANKKRWLSNSAGQMLGLVILGFTSIYREGFETVLFLQALVLESGVSTVMIGVGIGLAATLLVGVVLFRMQVRLPYKKMLIVTGIMIGVVLLTMVGNTVHILQVVGWFPLHPIRWLQLPNWMELWFGVYPSWEGISLQALAAIFTIGSYFVAEQWGKRTPAPSSQRPLAPKTLAGVQPHRGI